MKRLFVYFIFYGILFSCLSVGELKETLHSVLKIDPERVEGPAFDILQAKCNICHEKKNPSRVFTRENMNQYAKKINKQVFVFKRMPKGRNIRLTEEEYTTLKHWLHTQNIR
ncbi:MAG: hypothetical protein AAFV80_12730 [Bacteroidota bacterium]